MLSAAWLVSGGGGWVGCALMTGVSCGGASGTLTPSVAGFKPDEATGAVSATSAAQRNPIQRWLAAGSHDCLCTDRLKNGTLFQDPPRRTFSRPVTGPAGLTAVPCAFRVS